MNIPESIKKELDKWNHGEGISPVEWINCMGRYDYFFGFSRLIWPELVKLEGKIYLADIADKERIRKNNAEGIDQSRNQVFINAFCLTDLFDHAEEDIEEDLLLYLAEMLRQSWTAKIAQDFPESTARVIVDNCLDEPGIGEIIISITEDKT